MAWAVLALAGVMEAVWAVSLEKSQGFAQPLPTVVFFAALAFSMLGLSYSLRALPLGTAYAVWVGIGCSLTTVYGMVFGGDSVNIARVALLIGLVLCIVGLKVVDGAACAS